VRGKVRTGPGHILRNEKMEHLGRQWWVDLERAGERESGREWQSERGRQRMEPQAQLEMGAGWDARYLF